MTNEAMLQIATGPVAALALCLLFIFFIGRWLAAHLPVWVDRHLKQIDRMVDSHNEDRQMYKESLNEVNKYAAMYPNRKTVYLAMHLNAGAGIYGAFFYHHASAQGRQLALHLCNAMMRAGIVDQAKSIAANPSNWTKNAFYTIKGVGRPVAICCEPLFMDQPAHAKHLTYEGIQGLAMCMANAIVKWGSND
jgi:hypothetical protein